MCELGGGGGWVEGAVSQDTNLEREGRAEAESKRGPSAYQPITFPLGQTGSCQP